jgi:serine protease Do
MSSAQRLGVRRLGAALARVLVRTRKGGAFAPHSKALRAVLILLVAAVPAFAADRHSPVVDVVQRVSPAVVNISAAEIVERGGQFPQFRDPFFDQFFGDFFEQRRRKYTRTSLGSGFIIRDDGYILTNQHVVLRAARITVTLVDERELEAEMVGSDADSDLAVLKVKKSGALPVVPMGTSSDLMIGETVIAIGNPFGLSHTVTTGVLSAIGRSLNAEEQTFTDLLQTDASINPGNSGGPLLNIDGEVIGVNAAIYQKAQGIGFAVPADRAKRVMGDLISYGDVQPAWAGVLVQPLNPDLAAHFRAEIRGGVLVRAVEADSPAADAGVRRGDVITEVDGRLVHSVDEWESRLRDQAVDSAVKLAVLRDDERISISLTLRTFPIERADALAWQLLGVRVRERRERVEVEAVRRGSSADQIGMRSGDIIAALGGRSITTIEEFRRKLIAHRNAQRLLISIQRGRQVYHVPMPLGAAL